MSHFGGSIQCGCIVPFAFFLILLMVPLLNNIVDADKTKAEEQCAKETRDETQKWEISIEICDKKTIGEREECEKQKIKDQEECEKKPKEEENCLKNAAIAKEKCRNKVLEKCVNQTMLEQEECAKKANAQWAKEYRCVHEHMKCEEPSVDMGSVCKGKLDEDEWMCICDCGFMPNKDNNCVKAEPCFEDFFDKKNCENDENAKWELLDECLEEQPSCWNKKPAKKVENNCGQQKKLGCKCNDGFWHAHKNGVGKCLDEGKCKEFMDAEGKLPQDSRPFTIYIPDDDEDYD